MRRLLALGLTFGAWLLLNTAGAQGAQVSQDVRVRMSLTDGSLSSSRPGQGTSQSYATLPSVPTTSDPPNTAIIGGFGLTP